MIDDLLNDLKFDEGWRPYAYQDHLEFWTIGYGFLIDERRGGELPKPVADMWLMYAATQRWNQLVSKIPWVLEQPENVQLALGNMSYQLGVNGVLNFKYMLAALQRADWNGAAEHALNSRWASQTPKRAQRIADLIRGT